MDVTDDAAVVAGVATAAAGMGGLDALINSAGVLDARDLLRSTQVLL